MKATITILSVLFIGLTGRSQDIHFTMFNAAPMVLNPGAAGVFEGTFRASTNYKTQWGSISSPYRTFSFSTDGTLFKNKWRNAYMGAGLSLYRDVAGTTNFGTTKIDLTVSTVLLLDRNNTFSVGLTGGWAQRTIAPGNLQWDAQFNGQAYDPTLPSNESYIFENKSYMDFGVGAMWAYGTAASTISSFDKVKAQVGIAYHHLARPELESYYGTSEKMYSKFVFHANMHWATGYSKLALRPRINAIFQGPMREINLGMMFRYLVKDGSKYTGNVKGFAIGFGGYYRLGDAFSPSIELEIAGLSIGYSYDFNTSSLRTASNGFGGSEIYLKFQNPNPFFVFSRTPSFW